MVRELAKAGGLESELPPEMDGAPLYAQILFTQHARLQKAVDDIALQVKGAITVWNAGHGELAALIGQPGDELTGIGSSGLAGQVAAIRREIGHEPQDGKDGRGILGRLHRHDAHRQTWDNRWRDARAMAIASGFFLTILGFILKDRLFAVFGAH